MHTNRTTCINVFRVILFACAKNEAHLDPTGGLPSPIGPQNQAKDEQGLIRVCLNLESKS